MKLRLLLLPLIVCLWGCSRGDGLTIAPVEGKIVMNGQPLPNVGVTFLPNGAGPSASGNTNELGEFKLRTAEPGDGAVVGGHKVVLGRAQEGRPKPGSATIPNKYGSPTTTDLSVEVVAGKTNTFTFELVP
jgi:hypothetical protein